MIAATARRRLWRANIPNASEKVTDAQYQRTDAERSDTIADAIAPASVAEDAKLPFHHAPPILEFGQSDISARITRLENRESIIGIRA